MKPQTYNHRNEKTVRNNKILRLARKGLSNQEIANKVGDISKARVHQIVTRFRERKQLL